MERSFWPAKLGAFTVEFDAVAKAWCRLRVYRIERPLANASGSTPPYFLIARGQHIGQKDVGVGAPMPTWRNEWRHPGFSLSNSSPRLDDRWQFGVHVVPVQFGNRIEGSARAVAHPCPMRWPHYGPVDGFQKRYDWPRQSHGLPLQRWCKEGVFGRLPDLSACR